MSRENADMAENNKKHLWHARPMRDSDMEAVFDLYRTAINRQVERPAWEWQFKDGPAGPAFIHVADHNGVMAGQYAIAPVRLQIQGGTILGAQSFDTMTHPDYRKQGIFTTLAKHVYARAASDGVELIYGFPNENSTHGFLKYLDFFIPACISIVWRPLHAGDLFFAKVKNRPVSAAAGAPLQFAFDTFFSHRLDDGGAGIRIDPVESFPPETADMLFMKLSSQFRNMVVRDARYLNWRYTNNKRWRYHILLARRGDSHEGYCVFKFGEQKGIRICYIMDIFADPGDSPVVAALLSRAIKEAAAGAAVMLCLLQPQSPFLKHLKRLGFILTLKKIPYILRINKDTIVPDMIKDIAQWHITYGDGDFM